VKRTCALLTERETNPAAISGVTLEVKEPVPSMKETTRSKVTVTFGERYPGSSLSGSQAQVFSGENLVLQTWLESENKRNHHDQHNTTAKLGPLTTKQ